MIGLLEMARNHRRSNTAFSCGAILLLMWNLQAGASTITWAGTHNSNWSTASNWSGGVEPVTNSPAYDVIIPATITGGTKSVVDQTGTSISLNSLTINSGQATGFTINNGSTLTLGTGSFTGSSTFSGVTVNGVLNITGALTNSTTISAGGSGSVTLSGNVTNTGGTLSSTGSATLTIGSSATVTGGTLLGTITNNGTLSGATVGSAATAATVNGGTISGATTGTYGTFNNALFSGATLTNGSMTGSSTATGTNTLAGSISNSGSLSIASGTTNVSGAITGGGSSSTSVSGTLNIESGAAIDSLTTFSESTGGVVTLSGTLDVSTANLLGGTFDGTGSFGGSAVNNGDGSNDTNAEGVELFVGGSAAAWAAASDAAGAGDSGYSFVSYDQDSGGTLGITFNSGDTGDGQLSTVVGASINGTLDLYSSNGAELNLSSLNSADSYMLLDNSFGLVSGTFSTVNVVGTLNGATGWQLVYNGADKPSGGGDVELDYVAPSAPEPGTDVLLGGALVGFVLLRRKLAKR